jgi:hypothetical protein
MVQVRCRTAWRFPSKRSFALSVVTIRFSGIRLDFRASANSVNKEIGVLINRMVNMVAFFKQHRADYYGRG